ncbi:TerB family tellurite resistance protein [Roseobacter sp.]|uniref:tellurite resistance TerB family protein n=1 Tax=Roseobacter sp. TaxID=1907202 RepID=UPI003296930D
MFADFIKRLTQPSDEALPDEDARLALTALLVRIARSDNDYSDREKTRIDQITARRYGIGPGAVTALRAEAEALEAEAPDTVRFTRAIKDAVPYEERRAVVHALWQVVLADGARAQEEDALVRMVTNFLGISDRDSALARQAVDGSA